MAAHGKLPSDPLASVKKGNVKTDRRYERRPYSVEEFGWLKWAACNGPTRYGMTGPERALLYCVGIQTGLRSSELRSLTPGRFNLHREDPTVTCKAKATKNSKDAHQHLRPETSEELRELLKTKAPAARVFNMPSKDAVIDMLRDDIEDARQAWITEASHDPDEQVRRRDSDFLADEDVEGRKIDFHALRYTTGAWLAMANVHPRKIQRIMRHSSITLTMDTYGHLFRGEEAETINHFPDMASFSPKSARATGTFDAAAKPQRIPQQLQHDLVQSGAKQYESSIAAGQTSENCKPLNISGFCDLARPDARSCNAGGGTRTHTGFNSQRILNPVHTTVVLDRHSQIISASSTAIQ